MAGAGTAAPAESHCLRPGGHVTRLIDNAAVDVTQRYTTSVTRPLQAMPTEPLDPAISQELRQRRRYNAMTNAVLCALRNAPNQHMPAWLDHFRLKERVAALDTPRPDELDSMPDDRLGPDETIASQYGTAPRQASAGRSSFGRANHQFQAVGVGKGQDQVQPLSGNMDSMPSGMHTPSALSRSATPEIHVEGNDSDTGNDSWRESGQTMNGHLAAPEETRPRSRSLMSRIREGWVTWSTLHRASNAPLPTETGDGTYVPEDEHDEINEVVADAVRGVRDLGFRPVLDVINSDVTQRLDLPMDDREYYMEALIQAAAKLGAPDYGVGREITNAFLTTLWNDLDHPPQNLLGDQYKFRQPDGSGNNCYRPNVGRAGDPYARTVQSRTKLPKQKPDPGMLFDTLMARKKATPHPNKISSVLFYLASIIIHDIFRTDHKDFNISKTSSYLDLAPLYGSNWDEQKRMRTMKDGKLKPDCFSETRLLSFPPGVGVILIMFNRYHNYIAENLALINEDGRFTDKGTKVDRYGEKDLDQRDDDLFQTARLVTCGLYINIILIDYVRTILNLNKTDSNWQLDPRADIPDGPAVGTGNQVSAEFNLVYRWHAAISDKDDKWTQALFKELFQKDHTEVGMYEMLAMLNQLETAVQKQDPLERKFPSLSSETMQRQTDGPFADMFKDDDLAAFLVDGIEDCANAFGPQQVPLVMKTVEILGIQQSRTWHLATLNEFRKHFSLTPHRTFESITTNHEVAAALKHLYDTPDNVELYPGLVVEDAKKPMKPGSGLCGSYTMTRAVLSDAVSLVRGDRFYTSNYTPTLLTNWGYTEAESEQDVDNGCVFYKLILRALPNNFKQNSIYAHYPLTVPEEMKDALYNINPEKAQMYDYSKPRPAIHQQIVFGKDLALQITDDQKRFKVAYTEPIKFLMGPKGANFAMAGDNMINVDSREKLEKAIYLDLPNQPSRQMPTGQEQWLNEVRSFYKATTERLLQKKSYKLGTLNQVDIIRDVINYTQVHFVSSVFSLPLKSHLNPQGIFTERELYMILAGVFITIFFDLDPAKSFPLRQASRKGAHALKKCVDAQVKAIVAGGRVAAWLEAAIIPQDTNLSSYGVHIIQRLAADMPDSDALVANILGMMGAMVANQGQLLSQAIDYLFSCEKSEEYWKEINTLAKQDTPEADEKLMHYFMEAARMYGESGLARFYDGEGPLTMTDTNGKYTNTFTLQPGDKVIVNLKAAHRDESRFEDADVFKLDRPLDSYLTFGWGPHACLGMPMTRMALTTMLKAIGKLDNIRPATVSVGGRSARCEIKKTLFEFWPGSAETLPESWHYHKFMTEDWDVAWPFPSSLKINWDDPSSPTTRAGDDLNPQATSAGES